MKNLFLSILIFAYALGSTAQTRGNVGHESKGNTNYISNGIVDLGGEPYINVRMNTDDTEVTVTGLANLKADAYVAIFALNQQGKTIEEVNELIDKRISSAIQDTKRLTNVSTYVDMISFVPVYEYDVEKKVFSKKNYTEIPKGFQIKKNIHIKFTNPAQLNDLITIMTRYDIYDLVKVDYFSSKIPQIKSQLREKAKTLLASKVKDYESILGRSLSTDDAAIKEAYQVYLPLEMYKSYQAYSSSSIQERKNYNVDDMKKNTTYYYQAITQKNFDFTINPVVLEPVLQVLYQVKLVYTKKKKDAQKYLIITPNGEVKPLDLK